MDISRECVLPTIFARHPAVYIHARVNTFVTYLVEATKTNVCICVCSCLTPSFVVAYYPTLSSGPLTSGSLLRKALAGRSTDSFSLPTLLLLSLALSLSSSLSFSLSLYSSRWFSRISGWTVRAPADASTHRRSPESRAHHFISMINTLHFMRIILQLPLSRFSLSGMQRQHRAVQQHVRDSTSPSVIATAPSRRSSGLLLPHNSQTFSLTL